MQRAGHELPKWKEVLVGRLLQIEIVRGCVMHVGAQPYDVVDRIAFGERQQIGDFSLTSLG